MTNRIPCPDCEGTGIYENSEGESWKCQMCDGECEVNEEDVAETLEAQREYEASKPFILGMLGIHSNK